mgnify:CR=1 FL=1
MLERALRPISGSQAIERRFNLGQKAYNAREGIETNCTRALRFMRPLRQKAYNAREGIETAERFGFSS